MSVTIRAATAEDWGEIWRFMRGIVEAGETFSWDTDTSEETARSYWMHEPPGRTVVAVGDTGWIAGTAETHPNHGGPGAHIANAGFMVDPAYEGRGVGRALCQHVLDSARADGYRAMVFNAVVDTNTRAVKLWQSFGFEILATIPDAFNHPREGYVGLHVMYRGL